LAGLLELENWVSACFAKRFRGCETLVAAKLHSVAKKQKDKIAAQKEEIAELRQQVGVLGLG
jgi:hypothetical protein